MSIPYPGASPDSVEREVIEPIEEAISGISGVDKINSNVARRLRRRSSSQFAFEKDLQQATQEIRDEISEIRNDLPPEMEEPILTRFDPADLPIVSLTLSSTTLTRAGADAPRRSDDHARAARHSGRRRGARSSAASSAS